MVIGFPGALCVCGCLAGCFLAGFGFCAAGDVVTGMFVGWAGLFVGIIGVDVLAGVVLRFIRSAAGELR